MKNILITGMAFIAIISLQACGGSSSSKTCEKDNKNSEIGLDKTKSAALMQESATEDGVLDYDTTYGNPPCEGCPKDTLLLDTITGKYYINLMLMPNQDTSSINMAPPAGAGSIATDVMVDLNNNGSNPNISYIRVYLGQGVPNPGAMINLTVTLEAAPERKGSKQLNKPTRD